MAVADSGVEMADAISFTVDAAIVAVGSDEENSGYRILIETSAGVECVAVVGHRIRHSAAQRPVALSGAGISVACIGTGNLCCGVAFFDFTPKHAHLVCALVLCRQRREGQHSEQS